MKRSASATRGIWTGTQKWFTGIVTTAAAVMTLMLNAKNLGLSPWLGLLDPNVADHAARRIVLSPRTDTLRSIGDSAAITATVTDARGGTLAGATLRWRSSDSSVATVDSTGTIVARGPGRATIDVGVRDVTASATVLVRQQAVRLTLAGDTLLKLVDGDTLSLAAFPVDARGFRINSQTARWHSPDTGVVRLDTLGALRVVSAGRAVAIATAGDLTARVQLDVRLTPAALALLSGAAQRAPAGRAVPEPVVVQVRSRAGQPVPATSVAFTTEDGEGSVEPASVTTDAQGRARVQWSLGDRAGVQRLFARVPALDSTLVVVADADPVAANTRIEVVSEEPRGTVGTELVRPVVVRVTDSLGVALASVRVAWSVLDGGTVVGAPITDSAGSTQARWTLGRGAGGQRLLVQVGNPRTIPAKTLRAVAEAGAPASLKLYSGDAQSADAGAALLKPIVVQALDSLGNPVVGASLRALTTTGLVEDTIATTDASGRATFRWSLGTKAGAQKLEMRLVGAPTRASTRAPLRATAAATARAGRAASIEILTQAGPSRGKQRVTARVIDEHGNPVRRAPLAFSATSGSLSGARSATDSTGRATVTWTASSTSKSVSTLRTPAKIVVRVAGTKTAAEHTMPAGAVSATSSAAARPKR